MPYGHTSTVSAPTAIRVAQTASIVLSAAAAGGNLGLSTNLIPRLLESPAELMLRQWQHMFDSSKIMYPGMAVAASLAHGYIYMSARRTLGAAASKLPLLAAGLSLAIVPYTVVVLFPTNRELIKRAAAAEASSKVSKAERAAGAGVNYTAQEEAAAKQLVDRWGVLNLGRSALLAAASIAGLWTYL